jgi:hypothetical protein
MLASFGGQVWVVLLTISREDGGDNGVGDDDDKSSSHSLAGNPLEGAF